MARKRLAIIQMADTGPVESTAVMLASAGFDVKLPDARLRNLLTSIGCDTVLDPRHLQVHEGYSPITVPYVSGEIGPEGMDVCDLYGCVKGHRSYPKVTARWPRLKNRMIWLRINGGQPEHVVNARGDMGDECRPGCPVVTPNRWYADETVDVPVGDPSGLPTHVGVDGVRRRVCTPAPWITTPRYVMWPPLAGSYGQGLSLPPRELPRGGYGPPMCLVHNLRGWGYGDMEGPMRALGVKMYGVRSPDGLLDHDLVTPRLRAALAYVHLKSNDAPGYALLEAMANGVPVVCARRLIWRSRMQDLLVPGETCLTFDRETHDALSPGDVARLSNEIRDHLLALRDPGLNARLGRAGRERLEQVMWSADRPADADGFRQFLAENLPG